MKKIILFALLLFSCKNENRYEVALKDYIKEDLRFNQFIIDNQLQIFKTRTEEQPYKYAELYKRTILFNKYCLDFEREALHMNSKDSLNISYKKLKDSLLSIKSLDNKYLAKQIKKLPNKIDDIIHKYTLLRKLKYLNFRSNHIMLSGFLPTQIGPCSNNLNARVLATRLNKNLVVLNIYSGVMAVEPENFGYDSFKFVKLQDMKNNPIYILRDVNNDLMRSHIIQTQSDTIFMDATIRTNDENGFLISKNKSPVIIGEFRDFDQNHIKEYLEFYLEK